MNHIIQIYKEYRADGAEYERIFTTGYGRNLFEISFDTPTVTEIKAYGVGVGSLFQKVGTLLDIGGQDTKAIVLDENGKITKFEINDRCAALWAGEMK